MAHAISPNIAAEKASINSSNEIGGIGKVIIKFKAKRQANKIMKGLNEAKKIRAGKTPPKKSFEDFLRDF